MAITTGPQIADTKPALLNCTTYDVEDFVDLCNRRANDGIAVALWEYREIFAEPHEKPTSRKPGDWLFVMKLDGVYYPIYHNTNRTT